MLVNFTYASDLVSLVNLQCVREPSGCNIWIKLLILPTEFEISVSTSSTASGG